MLLNVLVIPILAFAHVWLQSPATTCMLRVQREVKNELWANKRCAKWDFSSSSEAQTWKFCFGICRKCRRHRKTSKGNFSSLFFFFFLIFVTFALNFNFQVKIHAAKKILIKWKQENCVRKFKRWAKVKSFVVFCGVSGHEKINDFGCGGRRMWKGEEKEEGEGRHVLMTMWKLKCGKFYLSLRVRSKKSQKPQKRRRRQFWHSANLKSHKICIFIIFISQFHVFPHTWKVFSFPLSKFLPLKFIFCLNLKLREKFHFQFRSKSKKEKKIETNLKMKIEAILIFYD